MTILHSVIFGIVEGVTEFLPISSTGHLVLVSGLLKLSQSDFQKSFEIIIQLGAIASVVALYYKSFLNLETLKRLAISFLPTGIIGLALYKIVKNYLIGNSQVIVWSLLLGGIALLIFEKTRQEPENQENQKDEVNSITYKQSALIGLCQSLAIIPGVSRSAATIVGGLLLGISRKTIVEFSFLLAVPTMLAATGLDLIKNAGSFSQSEFGVLTVGFIVSFLVAIGSIKFLVKFVKNHKFTSFGIYRIIIAIVFMTFLS